MSSHIRVRADSAVVTEALGANRNTLKGKFGELIENGRAELHGNGRGAHYRLLKIVAFRNHDPADEILDEVKLLKEEVIIIDGPAGLGQVTRSILLIADVAHISCGPSVLDLRAASDAVRESGEVNQFPRFVFGGVRGATLVVLLQPGFEVGGETDVSMVRVFDATEEVDVVHWGWSGWDA